MRTRWRLARDVLLTLDTVMVTGHPNVRGRRDRMLGLKQSRYGMWATTAGLLAASVACGGSYDGDMTSDPDGFTVASDDELDGDDAADEAAAEGEQVELGQLEQAWWWPTFTSSCYDPTGTDSVLAAIAVATAKELRRWQPLLDFKISNNMVVLTDTGKARCADRTCFNTQALLDLQNTAASNVEIRPGVKVSPSTLRDRLTKNYNKQKLCNYLWSFWGCRAPDHEFKFLTSMPGACDMNYWFEVRTPSGGLLSSSGLADLKEKLVWLDEDDNTYIQFQTSGNTVAIDPTYGLNGASLTTVGSCSAACTKVSNTDITGQCCSCNGTKTYKRSPWNASTYLCQ